MHRRYNRFHSRFDQPDPSDGSYDLTDPQSFNRYSYTQNDPVNFVDPSGLMPDARGNFVTGLLRGVSCGLVGQDGREANWYFCTPEGGAGIGEGVGGTEGGGGELGASSQRPSRDCWTPNKLAKALKNDFDKAWSATEKSNKENGGLAFMEVDRTAQGVFAQPLSEGTYRNMPKAPEEIKYYAGLFGSQGASPILFYHSHTNGSRRPSGVSRDQSVIVSFGLRGAIGVILYGPGKHSFYDENGLIPDGHAKLADCLPNSTSYWDY